MIRSILVPVDGSAHAQKAIELATDLALKYGAKLEFVHVGAVSQEIPRELARIVDVEGVAKDPQGALEFLWRNLVQDAASLARKLGAKEVEETILIGDPASEIVGHAKHQKADMIVMGSRGRGALTGLLLGSVSHKVTSLAPCTCVVVH